MIARAPQFAEELLIATSTSQAAAARAPARRARRARPSRERARRASRVRGAPSRRRGRRRRLAPASRSPRRSTREAEVYAALVLGTRDYVDKNGFEHVVLGLSGGIDSALVALRRRRRARAPSA